MRVLAGDIGGTNSRLALFDSKSGHLKPVAQQTYPSADFGSLTAVVSEFLRSTGAWCDAVCLGLPGPVHSDEVVQLTNLPWTVERRQIREATGTERVALINDVEASAAGVLHLREGDTLCLHEGKKVARGNRVVISIGTGLGVGGLTPFGEAFATEAGHATFAPRTDFDIRLMKSLQAEFGHVSWERVASGPALPRIHSLLAGSGEPLLEAAQIVERESEDDVCSRTIAVFRKYVGAVAGNIALTVMATGGIYFTGGVAPRIMTGKGIPSILAALFDKGRMQPLLERMPVRLVRENHLALCGAGHTALRLIRDPDSVLREPL